MRQCEVFVHDRKAGVLTENARFQIVDDLS